MNNRLCIKSMLDNDLYKFSMGMAVLELFPDVDVVYRFRNRGKQRFNREFLDKLQEQINLMSTLYLTDSEYNWLKNNILYLKPSYFEFLKNYRYDPSEVKVILTDDNDIELEIRGKWHRTIYWEVPLLAIISETYFNTIDTNWTIEGQDIKASKKMGQLTANMIKFSEFGTRRRRSFETQETVIKTFNSLGKASIENPYMGTSNVYFSYLTNKKPIGTMAHEWVQAISALISMNHPNYYMMENWVKIYNGNLGIALTDTYTLPSFLKDFNMVFAKLFDGVRHDSGDPFKFVDKIVEHYNKMKINPIGKAIVFSDGLNIDLAIKLKEYCKGKIQCFFGIGTFFTNDFENSNALNIVIKLHAVNDIPVVKLSDCDGKAMGDPSAVRIMKWIHCGVPLDEKK